MLEARLWFDRRCCAEDGVKESRQSVSVFIHCTHVPYIAAQNGLPRASKSSHRLPVHGTQGVCVQQQTQSCSATCSIVVPACTLSNDFLLVVHSIDLCRAQHRPVPCSACMNGRGARGHSYSSALSRAPCCCHARSIPKPSGAAHCSSAVALRCRRALPRADAGPGRVGARRRQAARRRRAGARERSQQLPLGVLLARHERGVDRALRRQRRLRARRGLLRRSRRDPLAPRKGQGSFKT